MKILGREPTLVIQAISAALSVFVALGIPNLSAGQAAVIVAAITAGFGVINALLVRPLAPAAFVGFLGAAVALLGAYGFEVSQEVVGALGASVPVLLALFVRGQVTPNADPRSPETVVG